MDSRKINRMTRVFVIGMAALLAPPTLKAVEIGTAYARHYASDEIRPIGQFFGAKLSPQRFRAVIPSQPDDPEGQYFIVRLEDWKSANIASARITLYATESKDPVTRTWDLRGKALRGWLYLGLTGRDWPGDGVRALAWHIELLDAGEAVLAGWKSFLWEMQ